MRALQLYLTSASEADDGFRIIAASRGIGRRERQRIGALSRGAPLAGAFRYFPLPRERGVILQTSPDPSQSGRSIAHALVFARSALAAWPVDYADWPGWQSGRIVPPGGIAEPVELIALAERVSFRTLQRFLGARADRRRWLITLLATLFLYPRWSRPLVIRDAPENSLAWIACLQKSLPLPHARRLSVSSFQHDGRDAAIINLTTPGSGFGFEGIERDQHFFMFDIGGQKAGSVIPNDPLLGRARAYAERVVDWLAAGGERLADFHRFAASHFSHDQLDEDLWWALRMYEHSLGKTLEPHEIEPVVRLVENHVRPQVWESISTIMATAVGPLARRGRVAECRTVIGLLVQAAHVGGASRQRVRAFAAWRELFDVRVGSHEADLQPVLAGYRELEKRFPQHREELYGTFLEPAHVRKLRAMAGKLRLENLAAALWLMLDAALKRRWSGEDLITEFGAFMAALVDFGDDTGRVLQRLLRRTAGRPDASAGLCLLAWRNAERASGRRRETICAAIAAVVTDFLHGRPEREAMAVRRVLADAGVMPLLFAEWRTRLAHSRRRRALYRRYRSTVLAGLDGYRERYFDAICTTLFEALAPKDREAQALDWLWSDDWSALDDELAGECLRLINARLPLDRDKPRVEALAHRLEDSARRQGMVLRPDKPLLRASIRYLHTGEVVLHETWFADVERALEGIGRKDYERFAERVMPELVRNAHRRDDHRRIVDTLLIQPDVGPFFEGHYGDSLVAVARYDDLAAPPPAALTAALHFWIAPQGRVLDDSALQDVAPRMRERLAALLGRWNEAARRELVLAVGERVRHDEPEVREAWRRYAERLTAMRPSLLDNLRERLGIG